MSENDTAVEQADEKQTMIASGRAGRQGRDGRTRGNEKSTTVRFPSYFRSLTVLFQLLRNLCFSLLRVGERVAVVAMSRKVLSPT